MREIGLSEEQALLDYRLAPLQTRRCIGILGLLHRVVLGQVSGQIAELFQAAPVIEIPDNISSRARGGDMARHSRQLLDLVKASSTDVFRRSIFGMAQCYNALPQFVVDAPNINCFQRELQAAVGNLVRRGRANWQDVFSDGRRYSFLQRFQLAFRAEI